MTNWVAHAGNTAEKTITIAGILYFGAVEANPVMGELITWYGIIPGIIIAWAITTISLTVLHYKQRYIIAAIAATLYALLTIYNIIIILIIITQ